MTRILWKQVKDILLSPYVDLKTVYYDLGLPEREKTRDRVTAEAAEAIRQYGVGVKCATITANAQRMEEYHLSELWKSPNATIRAALDGTVFRTPIVVPNIRPAVAGWEKPITIARHAFGDIYKAAELRVSGPGTAELVFTGKDGRTQKQLINEFDGPGVLMGQFNRDDSITSFAHSCFRYALDRGENLLFSAKDTISKRYDQTFKGIFADLFERTYRPLFEKAGVTYEYTLIDDAVARIVRSKGGMIWALKNYDGDVMSDMVAAAFGSLAMMTSVLMSPDGVFEYEAAHGTVTRHYYRYLKGEATSTNPVATLFAWTGALRKRGELDGLGDLSAFAAAVERATLDTIAGGTMTGDLALLCAGEKPKGVSSEAFLRAVASRLEAAGF